MAKDNIFEQDLQLQGIAKILNLRLDVLDSISGTPIAGKQGGLYFDSVEESLRVNVDGTNWFSAVLFNGLSDDVVTLPVFTADELNKVEKFINDGGVPQLLYLDRTSEVKLIEKINFTHFLDPTIITADYTDIAAGETLLPTAGAVYDYVTAALSTSTGDYLPLAGGEMVGNILMGSTFKINFFNTDHYIQGVDSDQLVINGKTRIFLNVNDGSRVVIANDVLYSAVTTNTYDLGKSTNKFKDGYFGTTVFTPKLSGNGALLTIVGGAIDDTKIEIGGDQVMFYDHIATSGIGTKDIGGGTNRWRYGYFNYVSAFRLYLNSTTDYISSIETAVDLADPNNLTIVTEKAIADLFETIETITGVAITDMEAVGMVTRFSGVNPENYYLAADDSWQSSVWLVSGTTLGLNSSLGITDFEFLAATTVAFGVNGRYSQLTYLDGGNVTLYLGEIGEALLTDYAYPIEIIGDMRTADSILLGGTLSTSATVSLAAGSISAVPVLSISTAILCYGISTDGTNIWGFEDVADGAPTPDKSLSVTINGDEYLISAQLVTP